MTLSPTSPASKSEMGKPDPAKSERGRAELAVIVTGGAGGGIGQGIVRTLAARGWSLVVLDVDASRLGELAEELRQSGAAVEAILTDITAPGAAEAAVETALAQFGRLDGLVNSAGIGLCKPLGTISDAEFDWLIDVDLRAAFRFSRAALPALLASQGSIVSIGSVHGARSMAGYGVYAAAKAGIEAMMRGVAIDYGARGVRANTVHPGLVMSPQTESMVRAFAPDPEAWFANYTGSKQLLPEVVTPEQIGETVEFLLSRRAAGITGQAITVDAGTTAMLNNREPL
jgi:NAD(P)-dependent dehydrogenase (short-subunit alcohol dehydrogenase family)